MQCCAYSCCSSLYLISLSLQSKLPVALSVLAGDTATSSVSGVTLFSKKMKNITKIKAKILPVEL